MAAATHHSRAVGSPPVNAKLVGTTKRKNGTLQVTYNRHSLYYYEAGTLVDQSGGCRVSFNLPATHSWRRFWVTEPGNPRLVAST